MTVREALMRKVRVCRTGSRTDECWLWTGARNSGGYPVMAMRILGRRRVLNVAKVALLLWAPPSVGEAAMVHGRKLQRACGLRLCICPDHVSVAAKTKASTTDGSCS